MLVAARSLASFRTPPVAAVSSFTFLLVFSHLLLWARGQFELLGEVEFKSSELLC